MFCEGTIGYKNAAHEHLTYSSLEEREPLSSVVVNMHDVDMHAEENGAGGLVGREIVPVETSYCNALDLAILAPIFSTNAMKARLLSVRPGNENCRPLIVVR